jgi:hypothetical protein
MPGRGDRARDPSGELCQHAAVCGARNEHRRLGGGDEGARCWPASDRRAGHFGTRPQRQSPVSLAAAINILLRSFSSGPRPQTHTKAHNKTSKPLPFCVPQVLRRQGVVPVQSSEQLACPSSLPQTEPVSPDPISHNTFPQHARRLPRRQSQYVMIPHIWGKLLSLFVQVGRRLPRSRRVRYEPADPGARPRGGAEKGAGGRPATDRGDRPRGVQLQPEGGGAARLSGDPQRRQRHRGAHACHLAGDGGPRHARTPASPAVMEGGCGLGSRCGWRRWRDLWAASMF